MGITKFITFFYQLAALPYRTNRNQFTAPKALRCKSVCGIAHLPALKRSKVILYHSVSQMPAQATYMTQLYKPKPTNKNVNALSCLFCSVESSMLKHSQKKKILERYKACFLCVTSYTGMLISSSNAIDS